MPRVVTGAVGDGLPGVVDGKPVEAQFAVDAGDARAACGKVRVDWQPRAQCHAIAVLHRRGLEFLKGLDRSVGAQLLEGGIQPWCRVERIETFREIDLTAS